MPTEQPAKPGPQPGRSAGLTLNLSSNNPFRNHAVSPVGSAGILPISPGSPFDDPPPRPVSRNPFLDPAKSNSQPSLLSRDTDDMATRTEAKASPTAEEIFDSLTLDEPKTDTKSDAKPPPRPDGRPAMGRGRPGPPRGENMPPRGRGPPPRHRPSRSQEEALRARRMQGNGPRLGPSDSPQRRMERRPRRNSDSSVVDPDKPLTEEEKKAREARRKEREQRSREMNKSKVPSRKLDIIDQLDATSIFGTGLFHHDGPFDALNPHRNKKGRKHAPMQAFPKDSLNNSIGGSGPLNARPDHKTFMGNNDSEAFRDYNTSGSYANGFNYPKEPAGEMPVFDPMSRGSVLHGDETLGLGTSTFLEGTPAPRAAVQRHELEQAQETVDNGLQRKKSLAQRIRNINRVPREFAPSGRLTNPEYSARRSPDTMPPATSGPSLSSEKNPFFNEFTKEPESISVKRADTGGSTSSTDPPPPPQAGLERRATADPISPTGEGSSKSGPSSLLARVKSLKGGRKPRISDAANHPPPPGTAV